MHMGNSCHAASILSALEVRFRNKLRRISLRAATFHAIKIQDLYSVPSQMRRAANRSVSTACLSVVAPALKCWSDTGGPVPLLTRTRLRTGPSQGLEVEHFGARVHHLTCRKARQQLRVRVFHSISKEGQKSTYRHEDVLQFTESYCAVTEE